jgi:hypothetical protein
VKVETTSYRGEAPRITPRALPDNAAQDATNARLLSGDLDAWRQFASEQSLATAAPVRTIFKLGDAWLSWGADVDVARGAIAGDTTMRTYLTGPDLYDRPQWTNYAMATTGAAPYPVETRPLGVPGPTSVPTVAAGIDPNPTSFTIDVLDEGDKLATDWTTNPPLIGSRYATVLQVGDAGNPAPSYLCTYDENRDPGQEAWAYRDFGVTGVNVLTVSVDFMLINRWQACVNVACTAGGSGIRVWYNDSVLTIAKAAGWGCIFGRADLAAVACGPAADVWNSLHVTVVRQENGQKTVTAWIEDPSGTSLGEVTATSTFDDGDMCGFANGINDDAVPTQYFTRYDNYRVQATGSTNYTPVNTATAYLFTYVNDVGDESAPSLPSATVLRPDGVAITVTTEGGVPSGFDPEFGIATKRIYRAVTGATGTVYRLVTEIPLAQEEFIDALDDTELGELLPSEEWDLPPVGLRGILALPNGVMVGFVGNQLCFSAQNYPHAWPVSYRLTVDTDIVAIGNIDTTVVIGTENFIYLATGNDPATYGMSKLEVPQACVAQRSLAYLTGIGVVFASPDGLIAVAGTGQVRNLTSGVFTRDQWQALAPETIRALAHDDVYWMFYEAEGEGAALALDMKADGFGLAPLSFHATAAHADPLTDKLFLVLDEVNEPSDAYLPLPSTAPDPDGATIYEFNAEAGDGHIVYRWRGKLHLLPLPTAFQVCQVKAADFDNLVLRLYADGAMFFNRVISDGNPFTLPMAEGYDTVEIEFIGTSRVRTVQLSEDVMELS